ncbi:unnamed protein product, partial [Brassica rapa subsp. trilocularis]
NTSQSYALCAYSRFDHYCSGFWSSDIDEFSYNHCTGAPQGLTSRSV